MYKSILFLTVATLSIFHPVTTHAAAEKPSNEELVNIQFKYGKDAPITPPLNAAMEARDAKAVKILIEHGVDINTRLPERINIPIGYHRGFFQIGETVLETAIERLDKELVKYFLKNGSDPHSERVIDVLALSRDQEKYSQAIKWELEKVTCSAVYQALKMGDLELISILINSGADINKICCKNHTTQLTPLQIAIKMENKKITKLLLDRGAKI